MSVQYDNDLKLDIGNEVYEKLIDKFPRANIIVAGGFLRDYYLQRPIKDIDIFIDFSSKLQRDLCAAIHSYLYKNYGLNSTGSELPDYDVYVHESNCNKLLPYNFIYTINKTPQEYVQDFDINLCKIYYDKRDGLVMTPDFLEDVKRKTITLRNILTHKRIQTFNSKYPDFTWNT